MSVPGRLTLWCVAIIALVMLAVAFVPSSAAPGGLVAIGIGLDALLGGICLLEALALRHAKVVLTPDFPPRGEVGKPLTIIWHIENRGSHTLFVELEFPGSAGGRANDSTAGLPWQWLSPSVGNWIIHPRESIDTSFTLMPLVRGILALPPPITTIASPLRLMQQRTQAVIPSNITIYPNMQPIRRYETLRRNRALSQIGMHKRRLVGAGREFEQLRDYLPDDEFRDINWKASAHHRKLITNVFQMERSQDVLLCLDAARMMAMPVAGRTALDFSIDAAILLAHTVQRQGDRVGAAIFRDQLTTFIKPAGGVSAVRHIIKVLVEIQPQSLFPSYASLVEAIRIRQHRRAMVFLFTDLNDPQLATNLAEVVGTLRHRHLLTIISLRDPLLNQVAGGPVRSATGLHQMLAARELVHQRDSHKKALTLAGAGLLESDADSLSIALINRYLAIKSRQLA